VKNYSTYEEKSLLDLVALGDETAFHTLFSHHRHHVYHIAMKLLQSASAAEDILQEIFLKIWVGREKLPEIKCFSAYLNTITRNHVYNALRKQANEELLLEKLFPLQITSLTDGTLDNISYRELQNTLQKVVATLTPQQRKVFELSRMDGLKHDDIARRLNISRETVKKHVSEALRIVRLQLIHIFLPLFLLSCV